MEIAADRDVLLVLPEREVLELWAQLKTMGRSEVRLDLKDIEIVCAFGHCTVK